MSMQAIIYAYKDARLSFFDEDAVRVPYQPATLKLHNRVRPSPGRLSKACVYDTSRGALPRDVIEIPALLGHRASERVGHPDQKPLELIQRLIRASSREGDMVLDLFAGSGTTLLAAATTRRDAIGFEISSRWYNCARARLLHRGFLQ